MQRHQRHIAALVLLLVKVSHQRHVLQIVLQRRVFRCFRVFADRTHEFLNVLHARAGFLGIFLLVLRQQTRFFHQSRYELLQRHGFLERQQHRHEHKEVADALFRTRGKRIRNVGQGAVQRHIVLLRVMHQLLHGAVADGALGHVDDAAQGHIVRRIDHNAQIRNHVAHFLAVIELLTAEDLVGNRRAHQHFFQHTALRVRAVENRHIAIRFAVAVELADAVGDPRGFLAFVARVEEANRVALALLCPQLFLLAPGIVRNHLIRRVEYIGGRAVILLELDDGRVGIILLKIKDIVDIRAAPAVNRLVVVAHNAAIPTLVSQQFDEHILRIVRILIFVHHDILEALAVHIQHRRMVGEQFQRLDEKVVKIQGIERFQARFVLDEDRVNLLAAEIAVGMVEPLVRTHQLVLRVGNFCLQFANRQQLIVNILAFQNFLQHRALIVVIINDKRTGIAAEFLNIAAEDFGAGGVECGNPRVVRLIAHQRGNSLLHFLRRLVGERQCQNMVRCHTVRH